MRTLLAIALLLPLAVQAQYTGVPGRGDALVAFSPQPMPSLATGSIVHQNYLDGMAINVPYTIGGTFLPGNVFTAQLSNATGSFASPVCRFKIDPVRALCPLTKLMDIPGNQFLSCNVTRNWGGNNRIHARPVSGATQYQFRFWNSELAAPVVRTTNTYFVNLNWTPALPNGTYQVQVRAFKNGAWCVTDLPWGDVCNVTIRGSTGMGLDGGSTATTATAAKLMLFPNPTNGDQLTVSLSAVEEGVETVSVDIFDLSGARVVAKVVPVNDGMLFQQMALNELASGLYMVNITAGGQRYTERLVIAK